MSPSTAFTRPSCLFSLLPFLLLLILGIASVGSNADVDYASVEEWGKSFAIKLVDDLNEGSAFDAVKQSYAVNARTQVQYADVNFGDLLNRTALAMGDLLRRRVGGLKTASKRAEEIVNAYTNFDVKEVDVDLAEQADLDDARYAVFACFLNR